MDRAIKQTDGIFYTPEALADRLLSGCPELNVGCVLDPACGELSLINAAQRRYGENHSVAYYGCDKHPVERNSSSVTVICSDFFSYTPDRLFDLIVTNPPYVRGNKRPASCREWYSRQKNCLPEIPARSDLWVYFLLRSTQLLANGGTLAAILPWSFFQSEYSIPVRKYLADIFGEVKCQIVTQSQFKDTTQKVVLLWMIDKGRALQEIRCMTSLGVATKKDSYRSMSRSAWLSMSLGAVAFGRTLSQKELRPLSDFCDVKIGIVPGATEFFVRSTDEIHNLGLDAGLCPRILTSGKQLSALDASGIALPLQRLLCLKREDKDCLRDLILAGEALKFHERRHCQNRDNWFCIKLPPKAPDAFFSYRATSIPMMVLNDCDIWNTNAIHGVYFKNNISTTQRRWIQVSLLSAFSLVDIERNGRTYGKNVLKIEPSALKRVKVFCGDYDMARDDLKKLDGYLKMHDLERAMKFATSMVGKTMGVGEHVVARAICRYHQLRSLRTGMAVKN